MPDEGPKGDEVHAIGVQQARQVICMLIGLEAIAQGPELLKEKAF